MSDHSLAWFLWQKEELLINEGVIKPADRPGGWASQDRHAVEILAEEISEFAETVKKIIVELEQLMWF